MELYFGYSTKLLSTARTKTYKKEETEDGFAVFGLPSVS